MFIWCRFLCSRPRGGVSCGPPSPFADSWVKCSPRYEHSHYENMMLLSFYARLDPSRLTASLVGQNMTANLYNIILDTLGAAILEHSFSRYNIGTDDTIVWIRDDIHLFNFFFLYFLSRNGTAMVQQFKRGLAGQWRTPHTSRLWTNNAISILLLLLLWRWFMSHNQLLFDTFPSLARARSAADEMPERT